MIFLGLYKAGTTVKYRSNFHNDTGTLENPTSPAAEREDPSGTFTALTAPDIINAKTGHYGGSIDTTGFASGQHFIRMQGTVSTAKTVATAFCFQIVAFDPADAAGLGLSRVDAAVTTRLADTDYTSPDNAGIAAVQAKTDSLTFTVAGKVDSNTTYVAGTAVSGSGTTEAPWGP